MKVGTREEANQDRPDGRLVTNGGGYPYSIRATQMKHPEAAATAEEITGAAKAALLHAAGFTAGAVAELRTLVSYPQASKAAWLMLLELYRFRRQPTDYEELASGFLKAYGEMPPSWTRPQGAAIPGVLCLATAEFASADLSAIRSHARGRVTVAIDVGAVERIPLQLAVGLLALARDLRAQGQRMLLFRATGCIAVLLQVLQEGDRSVVVFGPVVRERETASHVEMAVS